MKKMMFTLFALLSMAVSVSAMSYEQARNEALFLTDKMAYELNLTDAQYEAAYEINLDYLMGVTSRHDVFGLSWERRNLDLSYILYSWQWDLFRAASYFYRPLYWSSGYWHFGIYAHYPRRNFFYFGTPHFYGVYRGGHSWRMNGDRSYYEHRGSHFRPNIHRDNHVGMRNGWDRGDYRGTPHNDGIRHAGPGHTTDRRSFGDNRSSDRRSFNDNRSNDRNHNGNSSATDRNNRRSNSTDGVYGRNDNRHDSRSAGTTDRTVNGTSTTGSRNFNGSSTTGSRNFNGPSTTGSRNFNGSSPTSSRTYSQPTRSTSSPTGTRTFSQPTRSTTSGSTGSRSFGSNSRSSSSSASHSSGSTRSNSSHSSSNGGSRSFGRHR